MRQQHQKYHHAREMLQRYSHKWLLYLCIQQHVRGWNWGREDLAVGHRRDYVFRLPDRQPFWLLFVFNCYKVSKFELLFVPKEINQYTLKSFYDTNTKILLNFKNNAQYNVLYRRAISGDPDLYISFSSQNPRPKASDADLVSQRK